MGWRLYKVISDENIGQGRIETDYYCQLRYLSVCKAMNMAPALSENGLPEDVTQLLDIIGEEIANYLKNCSDYGADETLKGYVNTFNQPDIAKQIETLQHAMISYRESLIVMCNKIIKDPLSPQKS